MLVSSANFAKDRFRFFCSQKRSGSVSAPDVKSRPKKIEIGVGPNWTKDGGRGWMVWCAAGFLLLAKLAFQNRSEHNFSLSSVFLPHRGKKDHFWMGPHCFLFLSFLVQEYAFFD